MQTRTATDTYGVDISSYQGNVDWAKMKAKNVKFVICRAYGSDHSANGDTKFEQNVSQARANGIPVGAYYFATPTPPLDLNQARQQAQQFIDKLQSGFGTGNYGDLIPFVDIEHNPYAEVGKNITDLAKPELITWIQEFTRYFESHTHKRLGIYCNEWFMKDPTNMAFTDDEMIPLASMPLWVAEFEKYWGATRINTNPAPNNFGGWTSHVAWQFSENGAGVDYGVQSTAIDLDVTKDLTALMSIDIPVEAPPVEEPVPTVPPTEPAPTEPVIVLTDEIATDQITIPENLVEVWICEQITPTQSITKVYQKPTA
jgi:GH25 family lysozyme M1 (1,4-beta-N-acetylmuramidase)